MNYSETAIAKRRMDVASGDVFSIKLHMTFAGQQCRPGFYLIEGGAAGDPDFPVIAAGSAVAAALGASPLDGFSAALSLQGIEAQDIQPATSRSHLLRYGVPPVGSIADDNPVPPQDSMLLEWTTALKGGKGKFARRARTYLPGIYSTGQISGFLISDLQDALSAFGSLLFDPFVTDGSAYQMHAIAFNSGTNPRTIKAFNPITDFDVDNIVAIQRGRRPGRGI